MIDGLAGVKNSAGTIVFVCSKCRTYPDHACGAPNKDQLVYMLVCQKCGRTLGEWVSTEQREKELREFAKRVELLTLNRFLPFDMHRNTGRYHLRS
jgi:hypothetical protein